MFLPSSTKFRRGFLEMPPQPDESWPPPSTIEYLLGIMSRDFTKGQFIAGLKIALKINRHREGGRVFATPERFPIPTEVARLIDYAKDNGGERLIQDLFQGEFSYG